MNFRPFSYQHPTSGRIEPVKLAWLWTLLFGVFYFAYKGVWGHAAFSIIAALATFGISWLIYPLFAGHAVRSHFERSGWIPMDAAGTVISPTARAAAAAT